jgi:hypothetical protein
MANLYDIFYNTPLRDLSDGCFLTCQKLTWVHCFLYQMRSTWRCYVQGALCWPSCLSRPRALSSPPVRVWGGGAEPQPPLLPPPLLLSHTGLGALQERGWQPSCRSFFFKYSYICDYPFCAVIRQFIQPILMLTWRLLYIIDRFQTPLDRNSKTL